MPGESFESGADPRRWLCLAVALVGPFLGVLDLFVVNVTVPSIRASLHATFSQVELVIAGYGLAYAVCLITGGRLGDLYGRRWMFVLGLGAFTATSLLCGLSPSANLLVFWRVMQGAAAALMYPQALAYVQVLFAGEEKRTAFSLLGVSVGLGSILGQSLGGWLVDANLFGWGWRAVFLINLPIGLLAIIACRVLPESQPEARQRLDLGGVAILSTGLFFLVLPLVEGREQGWPLWSWAMLVLAGPVLWAFYLFEQRKHAREGTGAALIEPALFHDRTFMVGLAMTLVYFAGHASMLLILSLYFQSGLGLSPTHAGWYFVPFSGGFLLGSLIVGWVGARLGRGILYLGSAIVAAGLIVLLILRAANLGTGFGLEFALLLYGVGRGLMTTPIYHAVLGGMQGANAGAVGGVLSTVQQLANSVGLAAIGVVLFGVLPVRPQPSDYGHVFTLSCLINLGLLVGVAALIRALPELPANSADLVPDSSLAVE